MKPRDVVIIGGGLAGGAAAFQLAQQGIDVLLLEKEAQPHHKVCGEFISYEAQYYLKKLEIDLIALGAQTIDRLRLTKGRKSVGAPLGFQALSLSRRCLDASVLSQAQSQGADVKCGITVTGLAKDASRWVITSTEHDPIIAKSVFLATGKHDLRGWSQRRGHQNDYIGFKMHFQTKSIQQSHMSDFVEVMLFKGGYAGLEFIENGKVNLCLVVTKKQFTACQKNWSILLNQLIETTPALALHLANTDPCWDKPLAIFGIPYGFVYRAFPNDPDGLFRLGDQMAVIPSICGDGIAIALHTGFLAADCYLRTNSLNYHRKARQQFLGQINYAILISYFLSLPLCQSVALLLCRAFPSVAANMIRRTRIGNKFPAKVGDRLVNPHY